MSSSPRERSPRRSGEPRSGEPRRSAVPPIPPPACVAAFRATTEEFVCLGRRVEALESDMRGVEAENVRLVAQHGKLRMRLRRIEQTMTQIAGAFATDGNEAAASS